MTGLDILRRRKVSVVAALAGLGATALLWEGAVSGALLPAAVLAACLALAVWLIRDDRLRARLAAEGGAGIVAVRERRIAYFGPETGGVIDLDALETVEATRGPAGLVWTLRGADGTALTAPAAAEGAEALLDALAALPGFDAAGLSALSQAEDGGSAVLFRRVDAPRPRPTLRVLEGKDPTA